MIIKSKKAHKLKHKSTALVALDKRLDAEKQEPDKPKLEELLAIKHHRLKPAKHRSFMSALQKLAEDYGYLVQVNSWDDAGLEVKAKFSFVGTTTLLLPAIRRPKAKKKEE